MRFSSLFLAAALVLPSVPSWAQNAAPTPADPVIPPPSDGLVPPPSDGVVQPPDGLLPPPDGLVPPPSDVPPLAEGVVPAPMPWPPMLIPQGDADPADRLDDLFGELKVAPDEASALRLERRIVMTMSSSGSETVDLLMSWATDSIVEEDYPLALDLLDAALILDPDFAEGWNRRATVHFRMGDLGLAIDDIQKTLTLEPRHFQAIAGLGIIFRSLDRPEQALDAFHRALEIHPFLDGVADAITDLEKKQGRDI